MPRIRYTGRSRYALRSGAVFDSAGDEADVSTAAADRLCSRGDFERVAGDDGELDAVIDAGDCPWCDEYGGDAVGQHAAAAHPDEWAAHKTE